MGLLTFGINVTLDGCCDHRAGIPDDELFRFWIRRMNAAGLKQLEAGLRKLGLESIPSRGNFITFRAGDAARVYDSLLRQGVIARPIAGYGMPEHLRVTVGLPEQNERFLASLERALKTPR